MEEEQQKFDKAFDKFKGEYMKKNSKTIDVLEKRSYAIEKKYGLKIGELAHCERFYHKSQLKKWLWTSVDPEDAERVTQCPKGHQLDSDDFFEGD